MSSWFRSFCSDLYIMARSWEKSCRSKLLRNFCTSKMDLFEAPVCNSVGYRKNKIPIVTNRTKTKSWEDKLRNGRVCESRIESKRRFGSKSWKMWVNWKLTQVSPMYFLCLGWQLREGTKGRGGRGPTWSRRAPEVDEVDRRCAERPGGPWPTIPVGAREELTTQTLEKPAEDNWKSHINQLQQDLPVFASWYVKIM